MYYDEINEANRIAKFLSEQNSGVKFNVWQHKNTFCVSRTGSGVLCAVWLNGASVCN